MGFFGFASKDNRPVAGSKPPHVEQALSDVREGKRGPDKVKFVPQSQAVRRPKRLERPARHVEIVGEGNPQQTNGKHRG